MDYIVCSILSMKVYTVKIHDMEHLEERLGDAWGDIEQSTIDNIIGSFRKQIKASIAAEGRRIEYKGM